METITIQGQQYNVIWRRTYGHICKDTDECVKRIAELMTSNRAEARLGLVKANSNDKEIHIAYEWTRDRYIEAIKKALPIKEYLIV